MFEDDWGPGGTMHGYGDGMAGGGAWMVVLMILLLVALLATAIFWAVRAAGPHSTGSGRTAGPAAGSARDVLDLRLARGEVTPEEYAAARKLLGG